MFLTLTYLCHRRSVAHSSWSTNLSAQTWQSTKVELAASSFTLAQRQGLQSIADHVAQLVDELILGEPEDYPASGIVVLEAPARWKSPTFAEHNNPPPLTLSGLHVADEPPETAGNTVRIALNEAPQPNYLSLAYQLAHELAQVKMGVRTDNYLDETFAVAVSLEVLRRLGYEGYMLSCGGHELRRMPLSPTSYRLEEMGRHPSLLAKAIPRTERTHGPQRISDGWRVAHFARSEEACLANPAQCRSE